jgi:hypothetical protein
MMLFRRPPQLWVIVRLWWLELWDDCLCRIGWRWDDDSQPD